MKYEAIRNGEKFAEFNTLKQAKSELSELGKFTKYGKNYSVGRGDVWVNQL